MSNQKLRDASAQRPARWLLQHGSPCPCGSRRAIDLRMSVVRIANGGTLLLSMAFYDLSASAGWVSESLQRTHRRHRGGVAAFN